MADVLALETEHAGLLPKSTYEMIGVAASAYPNAPALSFFRRIEDHSRPEVWNYATLFDRITATANLLHELGVGSDDVVAFVLPNLPQTHLAMWGGQAAGIAFAINPMLEPTAIAELLNAGEAKVLITLAPFAGMDLWSKLRPMLGRVRSLRHVVLVDLASQAGGSASPDVHEGAAQLGVHDFAQSLQRQPADRLMPSFLLVGQEDGQPVVRARVDSRSLDHGCTYRVRNVHTIGERPLTRGVPGRRSS